MKKLKDPAFLFYADSFISGTYYMTDEEVGQYIRLLCRQFDKGHLKSLGDVSEEVKEKFVKDDDGLFYNERLDFEVERRKQYAESRRKNGAKGGRPKAQENQKESTEKPHANSMPSKSEAYKNHTININRNTNTNTDINTSSIKKRLQEVNRKWGITHE